VATQSKGYRQRIAAALYLLCRYYAAFTLLMYGFAKLMGAQFTVLDSELAKPMGDVSGFWLTWYYFGYSAFYSSLIAWIQILGALLLCFSRTALVGALLLMPVLVNIVGIDIWVVRFPLASGALRTAIGVLLALLVILAFHAADLWRLLIKRRDDLLLFGRRPRWVMALPIVAATAMTVYQAKLAYWVANTNNRDPSPLDGAWHVVEGRSSTPQIPDWIYFEYNRAYMVVFQFPDGRTQAHDFRVDKSKHTLSISKVWLNAGSRNILSGTWRRDGDTLEVDGKWDEAIPIQLRLERRLMKIKDHE
jgi:hypothetical protein